MLKWLFANKFDGIVEADTLAALNFLQLTRQSWQADDGPDVIQACSDGLVIVAEKVAETNGISIEAALAATGFTNSRLDDVYRWALGLTEKAADMVKSPSETARNLGFRYSFGGLLISHLYRMRFIETQVTGANAEKVRRTISDLSGCITALTARR